MKNEKAAEIKNLKKQIAGVVSKGKITGEYFALQQKLADLGDADALTDLGSFFHEGYRDKQGRVLIRKDLKASMQCFLLGAAQGNTYAMIAVADSLSATGKKDALKEAEELYKLAFKLGDVLGAYNLACTYLDQQKHSEAVRWFKICIKKGDLSALLPLAYAELYGIGTRRDAKAALDKFRRVARGGRDFCQFDQEEAMLTMAEVYRNGWFVPRDLRTAIGWLQRAAKLGSAAAQGLLADLSMGEEHSHEH
jgi:TPR repeat protein